jgi:putative Ca2+/H+ antiporter (TMEM165/GDT1 family)
MASSSRLDLNKGYFTRRPAQNTISIAALSGSLAKRFGVFGATFITFFLAEMGDKTQIATVAMAAHYAAPLMVVIGTTVGMLIADVPAVFAGDKLANKIPMKLVHSIAAAVFAALGIATLMGAGAKFGS